MLNLASILEFHALHKSDEVAFYFADSEYTFSQINAFSNRIANALREAGIQPGDKVALSCANTPHFPMVYYGILKAGAVVVPLSILLKHEEVTYHLKDSGAVAYFCFEGNEALPMGVEGHKGFKDAGSCEQFITITADPAAANPFDDGITLGQFIAKASSEFDIYPTDESDTAVIIYTSGTTGKPKGAELSHSNLSWNAKVSQDLFQMQQSDVTLTVLPLFHIFGQTCMMNASMFMGIPNVLLPRFDAETVLKLFKKHNVTVFAGVPTMYWGLVHTPDTPEVKELIKFAAENVRLCVSGGASLPVHIMDEIKRIYNIDIFEGYGMSEGSPVVTFNHPGTQPVPGSIGTPIWGVFVKIVKDDGTEADVGEKGELWYKGHSVTKGYYNKPEANANSFDHGWFRSGDIAEKDEHGYYYIVDRSKDMVNRGGLNVYPREIEEVLIKHPAVSMAAVIGVPDEKMGEEIKACIILKDGQTVTADELKAYTKEHLADYKYPRIYEFMDAFPISASGKILKRELRKM